MSEVHVNRRGLGQLLLAARLAVRGAFAYRRRSLQTLVVISFGVALVVVVDSFMKGFAANVMGRLLSANGHLSLTAPGYAEQREVAPIDLFIPNVASVSAEIADAAAGRGAESSFAVSPSILSAGLVSDGERSVTAVCRGIDPWWQGSVVPVLRDVARQVDGVLADPGAPGMIVSRRVADKLGARPGDLLMFLCSDRYGSFGVVEVPLRGVFPRSAALGDEECFLDLRSMQSVTGLEGGATEISLWCFEQRAGSMVLADDSGASALVAKTGEIAARRGLTTQTWREISASFASMMSFMDLYLGIMYAVFAVVAAVGMTNSVLLSVQDRVRDIATLRVVALSRGGVSAMIALECLTLGLLGATAGAVMGGAVSFALEHGGFMLRVNVEAVASYMGGGLSPRFSPGRVAAIAGAASVVPLLASLLPIFTMRRITVREGLGSV
jgi:putative ABC transport system permease protein